MYSSTSALAFSPTVSDNKNTIVSSQACLIADIVQHFVDAKLEFDAPYIYEDVNKAIQHVHRSGLVHRKVLAEPQKFLIKNVSITALLFLCWNTCILNYWKCFNLIMFLIFWHSSVVPCAFILTNATLK
jgi:hypothetical protein